MSKRSVNNSTLVGSTENPNKKMKESTRQLLQDIPPEVLVGELFIFNEGCELIKMRRVCKGWKSMIDNQVNWKDVVKNRLNFLPIDVPECLLETFPSENAFWKEYFICKIAYGKYSTVHECRQKGHVNILKAFSENAKDYQNLTFSVESITQEYCEKLHPKFKIIKNDIDEEYEEEEEETEEEKEVVTPESLYWKVPLESVTSGYSIGNGDDLIAVGESKIGGWPDLPKNYQWPTLFDKKWMFGCQINIKHLSYYDRTGSLLPKDNGMLYFFCDPNGGGNGSYCAPKRSSSQPVLYITENQIKEMGGLERQEGNRTYCNAAKMKFHSVPHQPRMTERGKVPNTLKIEEFSTPFDDKFTFFSLFSSMDFDSDIEIIDEDVNDDPVDYSSQSNLLVIYSGEQELRSGDQYLWEWGIPKQLIGKHEFFGCAVTSGDP